MQILAKVLKNTRKKHEIANSFTRQNSKINMSKKACIPSYSYLVSKRILTVTFKCYAHPKREPNIIRKMLELKPIPRSIKK